MNKFFISVFMLFFSASLTAKEGFYINGSAGPNWTCEGTRVGFLTGAAVGYEFNFGLKLEAEYCFRRNNFGKTVLHTHSILGNILYNLPVKTIVQPYVGIGLGYGHQFAYLKSKNIGKGHGFVWDTIAGFEIPLNCRFSTGVQYKYLRSEREGIDHSIAATLKYYL